MHINKGFHTYFVVSPARGLRVMHTCLHGLLLKLNTAAVEALISSVESCGRCTYTGYKFCEDLKLLLQALHHPLLMDTTAFVYQFTTCK
jgi:hypothetical protein